MVESLLLAYWSIVLFPLAVLSGPIVALAWGFLISTWHLTIYPVIISLIIAGIINDLLYFSLWRLWSENKKVQNKLRKISFLKEWLEMLNHLWIEKTLWIMLLVKNIYGLAPIFTISAGISKIEMKKYFLYSIPITLLQMLLLIFLGYSMWESYHILEDYMRYPALILVVVIVILYFITKKVGKYSKKKLKKTIKKDEIENFEK